MRQLLHWMIGVVIRLLTLVLVVGLVAVGVAWGWVHATAAGRIYDTVTQAPARDVGLVMGAAAPNGQPSAYLAARLDVAIGLYGAGKVKVLLVSGHREANYSEPDAMRRYLVDHGVASGDVVADYGGDDTWASCVRARRVFGVDRLTVISQRYHLYRSITACQAAGVDAIGVGDDSRPHDLRWWSYQAREVGANAKLGFDVLTRRLPPLDPPTPAVQDALAAHA